MVKGGNDIEFNIDFGLTKLLKSFIYKQYGVLVFDCDSIKSFIVNAELDFFFLAFWQKGWGWLLGTYWDK